MVLETVIKRFIGLSTDSKPTSNPGSVIPIYAGSEFYELDTGVTYVYDGGGNWTPKLVNIGNGTGGYTSVQNPLPTDGDSIYVKDIKDSLSNVGTFTGADLKTLFNNLDDTITSTDVGGLSYLEFYLVRPAKVASVAMVAKTGSFSNIKVIFKDRQGTEICTIDDSANNTLYKSHDYSVPGAKNVCCIRLEFHTTNEISLSFVYIRKTLAVSIESIDSIVSEVNTTSTLLLADATFTGVTEDIKDTAVIQIAVYSDQSSAALGLKFQFSIDGTNWNYGDLYNYIGGTGKTYSIQPVARYFRILYTNGSVNQSEFSLQTVFKSIYSKPSSHRVGDLISPEDDAELGKAVLAAQKPNGDFTPIDATAGGNLKVSVEEFESAVTTENVDRTVNLDGKAGLNTNAMMFGRVSDSIVKNARLDASTESFITVTYEHHELHDGTHFTFCGYSDVGLNDTVEFAITTPNTTRWAHTTWMFDVVQSSIVDVYEGASGITGGTTITPINNNRNSATLSTLVIVKDPTSIASDGTLLPISKKIGANKTGGFEERSREIIFKQNTTYLFRITSLSSGNTINACGNWYEHIDRN